MDYKNFQTFTAKQTGGILTIDINFGPVNVQGQEMLADLSSLCLRLERDRSVKVVVFESSNPDYWVCHYDTNLLRDMSIEAVPRNEVQ